MTRTIASCLARATLVLASAGCGGGGGDPGTLEGVTKYDAVDVARDAMNDEILDSASIAYKRTLVVGDTVADQAEDGRYAWRVSFVTVDDKPSGICIWVWIDSRQIMQENYTYAIDECPTPNDA